jgi:hypothetical protein
MIKEDIDVLVNNKVLGFLIVKVLHEIEKDLKRYKNDPFGFRNAYGSAKLKELNFLPMVLRRYFRKKKYVNEFKTGDVKCLC